MKRVKTYWETWTYDVWGNEEDGFDVNDRSCISRQHEIACKVKTYNPNTPQAFESAYPSDKDIRQALDIKPRVCIDTDGDDITIYVNASKDGYPLGELHCISHKSLSPIEADSDFRVE